MVRRPNSKWPDAGMVLALVLILLLPGAGAATPETAAWGITYDWEEAETDVETVSSFDLTQLIADIEDTAADNDFTLAVDYNYHGATHLYLAMRDGEVTTVTDADGNTHAATARLTTLTLRHATATSVTGNTDWSDYKAGFDLSLTGSAGTTAVIDVTVIEYITDDGELVGADVASSGFIAVEGNVNLNGHVKGRSDTLHLDDTKITTTGEFRWSDYTGVWRLRQPSPVYNLLASVADDDNQSLVWDCDEWYSGQSVSSSNGHIALREACGSYSVDFVGSYSYDFQLANFPADEMGLPAIWERVHIYDDYTTTYETNNSLSIWTEVELDSLLNISLNGNTHELALLSFDTPLPEPLTMLIQRAVGDPLDALDNAAGLGTVIDHEIEDVEDDYDKDSQIIEAIIDDFESSNFGRDFERFEESLDDVFAAAEPERDPDDFQLLWLWDRDADCFLMPRATYFDGQNTEYLLAGPALDDLTPTATALNFTHSTAARTRQGEVSALRTRADILGDEATTDDSIIASAPLLPLLALLAAVAATRRKRIG